MFIAIPVAAALFVMAPLVMTLMFGNTFTPGILTLRMLSCLIIVFTLASVFGHIGLIIYGKEKVILIAAVTGAILNFTLNRILIPQYMHQGAAVASMISECVVTLLLVLVSLKCCKIKLINRKIVTLAVFSVLLCLGCVLISFP
jgi:O-antigen/teichoic acid export membrane protein